jgi:glucosyl-3-phosphoglycerate synthase
LKGAGLPRIPGDWGIEVGVLAEVHQNCALSRVCQVDLSDSYEHKHQPLTLEDPDQGLLKMGTDIAKCLFRVTSAVPAIFRMLLAAEEADGRT